MVEGSSHQGRKNNEETLEFVDKLQADLDEANAAKAALEGQDKIAEGQVVDLQ